MLPDGTRAGGGDPVYMSEHDPFRVVIAGGGVAGLEALAAMRALARTRVEVMLVAPAPDFVYRPQEVGEPFGLGEARHVSLADLTGELGARFVQDAVDRVLDDEQLVILGSGARLPYDALLLAVGARAVPAVGHGVSFDRSLDPDAFDAVLADLRSGHARRVAFVVPYGQTWALPAYELALLTNAASRPAGGHVSLVTAEHAPLEVFGPDASRAVAEALRAAGIELIVGARPEVQSPAMLIATPGGRRVAADRIVTLPLHEGPATAGIPVDARGQVVVDAHGRVRGMDRVFAAGDATDGEVKQGGLAAQQAAAAAQQIVALAGTPLVPEPATQVLRGLLSGPAGPLYLRRDLADPADAGRASSAPLWWPATKVASRWLAPWLAARETGEMSLQRLTSGGIVGRPGHPLTTV